MRTMTLRAPLLLAALLAAAPGAAPAQDGAIEVIPVRGSVSMLVGRGGNIGLCAGADGAFLVDDQFANLTERILAAVATVTGEPVRFVFNTHFHGDHTGGNENLGSAGAIIVAHDNVRHRLASEQFSETFDRTTPAAPAAALPVVTFAESLTFHWNGETIAVHHVPRAHTDGDAIVHFQQADVLHMGDTFFNGMFPYIDFSSGGVIDGVIAAAERGLALAGDETRIIPGHGPLCGKAELAAYRDMLVTVRGRIRARLDAGVAAGDLDAGEITAGYGESHGGGFLDAPRFVHVVVQGMLRNAPRAGGR